MVPRDSQRQFSPGALRGENLEYGMFLGPHFSLCFAQILKNSAAKKALRGSDRRWHSSKPPFPSWRESQKLTFHLRPITKRLFSCNTFFFFNPIGSLGFPPHPPQPHVGEAGIRELSKRLKGAKRKTHNKRRLNLTATAAEPARRERSLRPSARPPSRCRDTFGRGRRARRPESPAAARC